MSALVRAGFADYRAARDAYDSVLTLAYDRAEAATNGALLNARGKAKGVDPATLFLGPAVRAYAYASPELVEHWEQHPRVTFTEFEQWWIREREAEYVAAIA
ncbi:hypothetical protein [Microbacterium sp. Bi128]|uniref:hypothetical protein n=1 Tax=Microbacterium sp. Bi128 TaxID=2821115 RepID=UPI001D1B71BC|nr:hypothetical protein [Microbacterium sp. Bi128]CAH0253715.1 hypothetical protein SRABI128_02973 [Microbacterium sp. Bi128]